MPGLSGRAARERGHGHYGTRWAIRGPRRAGPTACRWRSPTSTGFDHHGKKYIDFIAGWCVAIGLGKRRSAHRDPRVSTARPTCTRITFIAPGPNWPKRWLGSSLVKRAKCYRAPGGSEAVEMAGMQLAMAATGRPGFVVLEDCYHGNTLGPAEPCRGPRQSIPIYSPTATGSGRRWTSAPRAGWSGCSRPRRSRHS